MARKELADVLVELQILSREQADEHQRKAREEQVLLPSYLQTNKLVSPEDLARALAQQAGVAQTERITEKMADPALLARVPLQFLRDNVVIPVLIDGAQTILTANPLDYRPLDELNLLLAASVPFAVSTPSVILEAINRFYPLEGTKQMIEELEGEEAVEAAAVSFEEIEEADILGMAAEAPIIKLVNHILFQALKRGASDIHVEPFERELHIRYRIDGVMYLAFTPPKRVQGAIASRLKIMANLNIAEKRLPQDGRIKIKVGDQATDIRVSVLPVRFGERIVMRLLDTSRTFGTLEELGFAERDLRVVGSAIARPNGIILVSGPTGSGKTTTLYSILSTLNKPEVNIITVEDPVEYQMAGVGQVQVQEKIGLTFAGALRSILRQDPDIVMIGEIRDRETAQIAIQAALTGHLVLSTIHTNSAPATITRLIDMGIEPFLIASSLVVSLAQRLVRKLCDACKEKYDPPENLFRRLGMSAQEVKSTTFYKPVGCEDCNKSGYRGRFAVFEVMEITNGIVRLTMERSNTTVVREQAIKDGMTLLLQDGIRKIKQGLTTIEEVLSVAALETGADQENMA